jgi:hypothetical protein
LLSRAWGAERFANRPGLFAPILADYGLYVLFLVSGLLEPEPENP